MNLKRDFDTVAAWGITVTLAYLLTPYIQALRITAIGLNYQILFAWALLMTVPAYYSYVQAKGPLGWKTLNTGWTILVIAGIIGGIIFQAFITDPTLLTYSYYQKWLILPGLAFLYTAYRMNDLSRKIYASAGALNLFTGLGLFIYPQLQLYTFQLAAFIQGVPMILDWYFRKIS